MFSVRGKYVDKKVMLESLIRDAYEKGVFNGTWLYAENGKIVSKGAMGYRDPYDKLPMREDSIFELASITKQFTATAVMLLVREGLLGLDDEVTKFFPQIPFPGVTIRHLLTHTGGIPETYDNNMILDEIFMKDEYLYAKTMDGDEEGSDVRLYPIGENEFGIKNEWMTFTFSDTGVTYDGRTCKKV